MKTIQHVLLISLLALVSTSVLIAQNGVGINTDNSNPDASALLDVKSTTQGMLVPRMTETERDLIPSPATGLLIYQNDNTTGFYYYNGTIWQAIANASSGGTLDASYDFGGVGLGRRITADAGVSEINGTDGFLITGTFGSGLAIGATNGIPEGAGTRMFFNPVKGAFRAGRVDGAEWDDSNVGDFSIAMGRSTTASGPYSTAMGNGVTASGNSSTSMGVRAIASGNYSTAMGYSTTASGSYSTTMGRQTIASGYYSTAMGENTTASGTSSTAMGKNTTASGTSSTAMGYSTTVSGYYSTAIGNNTTASSFSSTAIGNSTTASGSSSTAMGYSTTASGGTSTAIGIYTTALSFAETSIGSYNTTYTPISTNSYDAADRLFTIGNGTSITNRSDAMVVLKNGNVGIGTSTPSQAKLEVDGFQSNTVTSYNYLTFSATAPVVHIAGTSTQNFSIWASSRIAGSRIWAHSDKRIKTNIQTTNNQSDLEKLMEIRITDYEFKDKANDGYETQKKVIAQEVKAIYPSAVDANNTKVIPDIMQFAAINANWVTLEGHDLKEGDKVRLVHATGADDFIVLEIKSNRFKVDFDGDEEVLVYGREVNDFHVVDYDALTTLNISATQAQQKTIDVQSAEIAALKAVNKEIKTQYNNLHAEVSNIKTLLNQSASK